MFDESPVKGIPRLINEIERSRNVPITLKDFLIAKCNTYLRAYKGDIDASIEIHMDAGLDRSEAEMEALDDLTERKPKGEFHAAVTVLDRLSP